MWVKSARGVNSDIKVAIKADKDTPYSIIKRVMSELQDIDENRYYLITSLKSEED
jgi:biopolymer transport protein ExbD